MNNDALVQIDHVTFGYDRRRIVLHDMTMSFPRGKVIAIMGGSDIVVPEGVDSSQIPEGTR